MPYHHTVSPSLWDLKDIALLGSSAAFAILQAPKNKEHKCYGTLKLFILRCNTYVGNTKQSFTMHISVVQVQHTPCMTPSNQECTSPNLGGSNLPVRFLSSGAAMVWNLMQINYLLIFIVDGTTWNLQNGLYYILFFFLKKSYLKQNGGAYLRNLNFCCIIFDKGQM